MDKIKETNLFSDLCAIVEMTKYKSVANGYTFEYVIKTT